MPVKISSWFCFKNSSASDCARLGSSASAHFTSIKWIISAFVILDFLSSDLSKKTPTRPLIFARPLLLRYKFLVNLPYDLKIIAEFFLDFFEIFYLVYVLFVTMTKHQIGRKV